MNCFLYFLSVFIVEILRFSHSCSVTSVSGSHKQENFCAGDLIFEENFDELDKSKWRHDSSLAGGGSWEFQWYSDDEINSYTKDGNLHIKPTLTSNKFNEDFVLNGHVSIPLENCTQKFDYGCERHGNGKDHIINPIRSARITTWNSFAFKYGKLEVRAKMPAGDWIWPAIWMMPRYSVYGGWPRSGEIDLAEMRGNRELFNNDGKNVGTQEIGHTLHYGPNSTQNGWPKAHKTATCESGYDDDFHVYTVNWTESGMQFAIDGQLTYEINSENGFYTRGEFQGDNPWYDNTLMAPFDQEFLIIINNAVGGINYFPDSFVNRPYPKPWSNKSGKAAREFWDARKLWEPTWNMDTDDSHLQVDYVKVWAV